MEDVTYQERLQAIAERRRQQEEEERVKRETDEEKWKLAQKQRKSLRDQWFSDPTPGDALGIHSDLPQLHSQSTAEEGEQEVCIRGPKASVSLGKEDFIQGAGGGDIPDMSQRIFHEGGQDGRSVLGMVAVQVERDPKTGATVVRSVAPVSAPGAAAMATTVFDDGRKSVHAIGGGGAQPSAEELERILSAIDGVGMTVLLDDVAVTTAGREETSATGAAGGEPINASPRVINVRGGSGMGTQGRGQPGEVVVGEAGGVAVTSGPAKPGVAVGEETSAGSDREAPVVLTFLGYADTDRQEGPEGVALGRDDRGAVLTVERVVVDGDGNDEEEALGPSAGGPEQRTDNGGPAGPAGAPERGAAFQEIRLDGSLRRPQAQGAQADRLPPGDPATAGGREHPGGSPKPKACQCCSVM